MFKLLENLVFLSLCTVVFSYPKNNTDCTIRNFAQVQSVINACSNIVVDSLNVPAGKTLKLDLRKGTTLTFKGTTIFEVAHWAGPLIEFKGEEIVVQGEAGSVLNAQGEKYWDGHGGSGGVTKPRFINLLTHNSIFKNLHVLNCAMFCVEIHSTDLTISGFNIDVSAGKALGKNTDAFGIRSSNNIVIENSKVSNQDDCIVVNSGTNMLFKNMHCDGSHGLSFSVGSTTETNKNYGTIKNVTFLNSFVSNGLYGIHIKTKGGHGEITDVTYDNIEFSQLIGEGIFVNQDYGQPGNINREFKITDLKIHNVHGNVGQNAVPVQITCNRDKCSNWNWSNIKITGGQKNICNYTPNGFSC